MCNKKIENNIWALDPKRLLGTVAFQSGAVGEPCIGYASHKSAMAPSMDCCNRGHETARCSYRDKHCSHRRCSDITITLSGLQQPRLLRPHEDIGPLDRQCNLQGVDSSPSGGKVRALACVLCPLAKPSCWWTALAIPPPPSLMHRPT